MVGLHNYYSYHNDDDVRCSHTGNPPVSGTVLLLFKHYSALFLSAIICNYYYNYVQLFV